MDILQLKSKKYIIIQNLLLLKVRHVILPLKREVIMFKGKAIVSSKGQVVIPSSLRKALGIHSGTELIFVIHDDVLEVRPVKRSIELFFGCCKQKGESPLTVQEMDEAIQKAVEEEDFKTREKKD